MLEEQRAMELLLSDRVLFMEELMQIENKNRSLVPMKLNPIQMDAATTSNGRDIYVKPAQVGFSSWCICDYLIDCLTMPGTVAVIISYDEFITGRLLRKADNFYKILKSRIPTIPNLHHNSVYEKTFPAVNTSFYIGSAHSFTFGRGETIHDLLLDEYGFWQPGDAERIFASALQRVPLQPNTKVRIGSTANGEDNDFHETYMAAKEGKVLGKSVFKPHFYPWWMHPEFTMTVADSFVLPGDEKEILDLDDSEAILFKTMSFNDIDELEIYNKIRWRRYKIVEMSSLRRSGETRLLFGQEYPEDDVSCFLVAGDMVYDSDRINELAKGCYPAQSSYQQAKIWFPPEPNHKYLIGVDPGLGKVSMSVATVWEFNVLKDSKTYLRHCATLSGLYEPVQMAQMVMELGRFYNTAMIAGEANLEFVNHIKTYQNVYYRTDPITGHIGTNIGWLTTPKTNKFMIFELARNLNQIITHDINFVSQLRNIRWSGTIPIAIGADDYHDSAAIAIACRESIPVSRGAVGQTGWKW